MCNSVNWNSDLKVDSESVEKWAIMKWQEIHSRTAEILATFRFKNVPAEDKDNPVSHKYSLEK